MALMNISAPASGRLNNGMTFFALGFRPFFFMAGLSALLLIVAWLLIYNGSVPAPEYYGGIAWHGHEMLFGYTAAVVVGFLLTAARNWTGIQTLRYWPLAGLTLVWLAGRLAPFFPGVFTHGMIALVDIAFLVLASVALAFPLFKSRQKHNIPLVFLLLAMAGANVLFHLELLGMASGTLQAGISLGSGMMVTLLVVMGGRVIPFFIERGLGVAIKKWDPIERLAVASVVLYVIVQTLFPQSIPTLLLAVATAVVHGIRVSGWYHRRIWSVSLLWVLFLGYGWVVLGLLMQGLSILQVVPQMLSLHAMTVGGIGVLTLGMMARVAIGHTGRQMQAHPLMGWAFALLVAAAVVRVLLPLFIPAQYTLWVNIAGGLWFLAFLPFFLIYFPILTRPRVDGQPG